MSSFVFYEEWMEMVKHLPVDKQLSAIMAIANYGLTGEMPSTDDYLSYSLVLVAKPVIDANAKRKEGAKRGGRPKANEDAETYGKTISKPMVKPSSNHRLNHSETYGKTYGETINEPMVNPMVRPSQEEEFKEHSPHTPLLEKEKEKENNNINIITKESEKEARQTFNRYRQAILKYGDGLIHQGWREVMEKQHGIQNWEQAFTDFSDHIEAHGKWDKLRQTSFNDFKSWFNNAAELFLTDEAKQKPRPKPKLVCEEFYRDGKRFVRQYDREIEIPLDARPRPMPIERYEWEPDQFDWVPIG